MSAYDIKNPLFKVQTAKLTVEALADWSSLTV